MSATDWISDRRALLEAATEGPWEMIGGGEYVTGAGLAVAPDDGGVSDTDAALIADSRTSLPKALDALEAVLELHHRREWTRMRDFQHFGQTEFPDQCDRCHVEYPCLTVAAITTALGVES